ncbi:MAG: restriction endonuclease [Betaproteobacteria bacterium]|nr:restriction endonuclease [Betaproteobacteria bacterium]
MQGQLFSTDFLLRGIRDTDAWKVISDAELDAFIAQLKAHYAPYSAESSLNEGQTEDELIEPVIDLLGWENAWTSQINLSQSGREDVPDFLLFGEPTAKDRAMAEKSDDQRTRYGVALLEAKRWLRPLDRGDENASGNRKRRDFGAPSSQMLRYLSRADVMSDRAVKWGILTNGSIWRLYWQDARSRAEDFFEIDLGGLLGLPGVQPELDGFETRHGIKLFWLLFGRDAFNPQAWDSQRRTFHAIALSEARLYEETVSDQLGNRVFAEVFPSLCVALAAGDPDARKTAQGAYTDDYLEALREAALVLLYRLLFLFYAEDRRLLPVMDARYTPYSLSALRDAVAEARDDGKTFSSRSTRYWDILSDLFRLISDGDDAVGMPAYNGGLFENARSPLLARARVADAQLAPVIDALSRRVEDILKPRINYRDLSVAHLGGIYERLLEYRLEEENGKLTVNKAGFARKGSGSYYTHDALVRLILDEAVGRLVVERKQAFDGLLKRLHKKSSLNPPEWDALDNSDPASRFLTLKICDPAMGSGHFLVALVDWLADRVLETAQEAAESVNSLGFAAHLVEQNRPWVSPVVARIADIRRRILKAAQEHGWAVDSRQLDDRHIVRRMILKRVIFGVDKNAMAVELAKVALWLHTFTVGAPLSFLDHHLRHGDSLFGGQVRHIREELARLKGGLLQQDDLRRVDTARMTMQAIGDLTDIDIAEAHHSKALMEQVNDGLRPLWRALDFLHARRWAGKAEKKDYDEAWVGLLNQEYGENLLESIDLLGKSGIKLFNERQRKAHAVVQRALARAARERFLHWELAFPTVWQNDAGGFDAVIGNPPWDRIKLQEVEWFAERQPEIAMQARAADRKKLIAKEKERDTPLWREYAAASEAAETAARVARECGDYPLLSSGDINLYSLFVERSQALVTPAGIVGLLTPSGIAADKGASDFFRTLTTPEEDGAARLAALYDFENRKGFFPDVDSRFKFCALVFGGGQRRFAKSRCAFYLHGVEELADPQRALQLTGKDFQLVNPNTGAAPIFRTPRDAELTMRIYRTHPVLVKRTGKQEQKAWPVKYVTMFHMTNDSGLFLTRAELEKQGWQPAGENRWEKDDEMAVPLYEGKMVQMYDHRAADVVINANNLHRAAQQAVIQDSVKQQPDRYPVPQFWVKQEEVGKISSAEWVLGFKEITAPTNVRSMIAALMPGVGFGNKVPIFLYPQNRNPQEPAVQAALLVANLNSFAFDFVLRQKLQGQTINLFILEQLPVIAPETFEQSIGDQKIADFIRAEVLALSYTAHDLAPFARDLGYVEADGSVKPPFAWDSEDRAQRMARLDALFFHLYGLAEDDAGYVLSTFPIVREQDTKAHGRYRTRDLILGYLERIRSGTLSHERLA